MDAVGIYLLLGFVIVMPVVWAVVGRSVRARAQKRGTAAGVDLEKRVGDSATRQREKDAAVLGIRLSFPHAAAGRAVVSDALRATRGVTQVDDTSWHIAHGSPRAIVATWSVDDRGRGVFAVGRATEMLGSLISTRTWQKHLARIEGLAADRGVAVDATSVALARTTLTDDGDVVWEPPLI